jgi:hypothetical protein
MDSTDSDVVDVVSWTIEVVAHWVVFLQIHRLQVLLESVIQATVRLSTIQLVAQVAGYYVDQIGGLTGERRSDGEGSTRGSPEYDSVGVQERACLTA